MMLILKKTLFETPFELLENFCLHQFSFRLNSSCFNNVKVQHLELLKFRSNESSLSKQMN
jgi:hypothetical protein